MLPGKSGKDNVESPLAKFYKGKRVLITGHTGFKGAWLSQILINWGAKVYGYALPPSTEPNLYEALSLKNNMRQRIADIRKVRSLNKTVKYFKPDIIFHLAAQPLVRDSYDQPRYTYETNVIGTVNVLEVIRENNIPAGVIITTDKVYRNLEKDIAYEEGDELGGYDPYSNSKACADLAVGSYIDSFFNPAKYGTDHKTLIASARSGNVIGGGDWATDRLIPDAIRAFIANDEELIIRSPNAVRPWQHVLEPLYGYLLLGKHLLAGEVDKVGAWNFGPEDNDMKSVKDVLSLVIHYSEKGRYRVKEDIHKHEAGLLKLNNNKAKKLLKWTARFTLEEAAKATVVWYKTYYSDPKSIIKLTNEQIERYFEG